ncbi:MAG: NAD(P)H-hydrate dehydratase [Candidatus Obscuribacterales bacterium]|nr:NAD(P)H-hydrate dehydratase [Candidatus Obscuribacterales bacterium]
MRIPTTAQIRQLESEWISQCGNDWGQVLMEIAGRAAAIRALRIWQERPGTVTIVCGTGNNGGDGLVVARYLRLWGIPCEVLVLTRKEKEAGKIEFASKESNNNLAILNNLAVPVEVVSSLKEYQFEADPNNSDDDDLESLDLEADSLFLDAALIVDAIFGTGLDRPVEGLHRRVIESINRSGKPVLSIDIPSGINSDTGQIMGTAVRADETVTFGYLKPGLLIYPGNTIKGGLAIVDIGLPELPEVSPDINLSTVEIVREMLPLRPLDAHKGTFGHVACIAGSRGMMGAATLSGLSALKSGAGLCYMAIPDTGRHEPTALELITNILPATASGSFSQKALDGLKELAEKVDALIIGPGISTDKETAEMICSFIQEIENPCIIDADALNSLALTGATLGKNSANCVITPHPKELARLMNCSVADIQKDRITAAMDASKKFGCTVLLKGAMTVVANEEGLVFINPTGNPGMATAGAGDVLSGLIGGLLAQKVEPFQAAVAGAYLHGRAGDILAEELGEAGIIAGDIERMIPLAIKSAREGERSVLESNLLSADSHN